MAVNLVSAPQRTAREGGVKSVTGEFVEETRLSAFGSIGWESTGCTPPSPTRAGCFDTVDNDALDEPKSPAGIDQFGPISAPQARYSGVECYLNGDYSEYGPDAEAALSAWEDREVEAMLATWLADEAVAGAAAANIVAAIAAVENSADENYVARPVLLMNRGDAAVAFAAGALVRMDGMLVTGNHTPVAASFAFPAGTVYATGALAVYATPLRSFESTQHTLNLAMAIAERVYAVGVDCGFAISVTVDPTP